MLELHAALAKRRDVVLDVGDFPAENRVRKRLEIGHLRNADHDSVRVEDKGEAVLVHEAKSEDAFVKRPGRLEVGGGDERDEVLCA